MRFEFGFNGPLWQQHNDLLFNRVYGQHITQNKKSLWFGVLFVLAGAFLMYNDQWLGAVVLTTGIFYFYTFWRYRKHYAAIKESLDTSIVKISERFAANPNSIVWEFLPELFIYKDFRFTISIAWSELTTVEVIEDTLLMEFKEITATVFFLAEEEVGSENFAAILSFLETRKPSA